MAKTAKAHSFPVAIALFCWSLITGIRVAVFNILFIFLLLAIVVAIVTPDNEPLPPKSPLLISPAGYLVDQYTYLAPEEKLLNPSAEGQHEFLVRDLISVIDFAANDPRITGLLLQLDHFQGGGLSKMIEVGQAIELI